MQRDKADIFLDIETDNADIDFADLDVGNKPLGDGAGGSCDYTPTVCYMNGEMGFVDSNGTDVDISENCCTSLGYQWGLLAGDSKVMGCKCETGGGNGDLADPTGAATVASGCNDPVALNYLADSDGSEECFYAEPQDGGSLSLIDNLKTDPTYQIAAVGILVVVVLLLKK